MSSHAHHAHDLNVGDWRTCTCGGTFKSPRSLHMHATKANRAGRDAIKPGDPVTNPKAGR